MHLTKRFGGLTAVNDVSFEVAGARDPLGHRAERGRQIDAVQADRLLPAPDVRQKCASSGERISGRAPHLVARQGVVRTFQETTIFRGMSVRDNVVIAHHLRSRASLLGFYLGSGQARADEAAFRRSADEILAFLGLSGLRRRGGEQPAARPSARARHCDRARHQPEVILLLDEPFAGMNHEETMRAVEMVRGVRDRGVTVLLVEHDMPAVMAHLRPHRRPELRPEDRGGHAGRDPARTPR